MKMPNTLRVFRKITRMGPSMVSVIKVYISILIMNRVGKGRAHLHLMKMVKSYGTQTESRCV